jgi:hypothetical protein
MLDPTIYGEVIVPLVSKPAACHDDQVTGEEDPVAPGRAGAAVRVALEEFSFRRPARESSSWRGSRRRWP